jgi:GTPase
MFVDEIRILAEAGRGGRGCVSFRRETFVPRGGPNGGNGGDGGSVYFEVDAHLSTFSHLAHKKRHRAASGEHGRGKDQQGARGEDAVVKIPPGTLVYDDETGALLADLVETGARFLAARGGRGGRGNSAFATSTNRAPRRAEPGEEGQTLHLRLELKLLADVGLVGLPNAGKSTLLARVSAARPKIADYPFTTLVPHLGVVRHGAWSSFVVADIPGLIEGAHEGAGLGVEFLKHIERTSVLVHLVDVSDAERTPLKAMRAVEAELKAFGHGLAAKPRILAASKTDLIPPGGRGAVESLRRHAERRGMDFCAFSAATGKGVPELVRAMAVRVERARAAAGEGGA